MTTRFKKPAIQEHKNYVSIKKRKETNFIVVHCAATQQKDTYDWKTIDHIHRIKGWIMIGYHFVITTDGTIQKGRDLDTIGAHVEGHNSDSVGICLIGGIDKEGHSINNFTKAQMKSLKLLIDWLLSVYPEAKVCGHRDFIGVNKDCPCFDVKSWYKPVAKYITLDDIKELPDILVTYNISKMNFEALNGVKLEEIESGDLIRVR